MIKHLKSILRYIKYYLRAKTIHHIHSPKLFRIINETIENKKYYYAFDNLKALRDQLLKNKAVITIEPIGAGSKFGQGQTSTISKIASTAVSKEFQCKWLFNISRACNAIDIIELGSSLGLSALYLSNLSSHKRVYTIEGNKQLHNVSKKMFSIFPHIDIKAFHGLFETELEKVLNQLKTFDLAFIDGDHTYNGTLKNFNQLLSKTNEDSIIVIDDIHWSDEMNRAWNDIKAMEKVQCTIDLFHCGLIFFDPNLPEDHMTVIRKKLKFFAMGFWS